MPQQQKSNLEQAKDFVSEMNAKAEELYVVRQNLNTREERFKKETDELYMQEAALKAELLTSMKAVGLKSVKVSNGDSFIISKRPAIEVLNESSFNLWAIKQKLVKPDLEKIKAHLKSLVKMGKELPLSVEFTNRDSVSVRKAGSKEE